MDHSKPNENIPFVSLLISFKGYTDRRSFRMALFKILIPQALLFVLLYGVPLIVNLREIPAPSDEVMIPIAMMIVIPIWLWSVACLVIIASLIVRRTRDLFGGEIKQSTLAILSVLAFLVPFANIAALIIYCIKPGRLSEPELTKGREFAVPIRSKQSPSMSVELERLNALHKSGALTDTEFKRAKEGILNKAA